MLLPSAKSITLLSSLVLFASNTIAKSVTAPPLLGQTIATEAVSSTSLNTDCTPMLGPVDNRERTLLEVIFSGSINGTTYAQWLVNYASQLTSQIDNVASQALVDSDGRYTTAFHTIDVAGILGLASAAPMYSCFLSSLWDEALPGSSSHAVMRYHPWRRKAKLMVLFEKRNDNNGDYNLAELLVRETEDLLTEVNAVISSQLADPSGYTSLFSRLEVRQLISIAFPGPARAKASYATKPNVFDYCAAFTSDRKAKQGAGRVL